MYFLNISLIIMCITWSRKRLYFWTRSEKRAPPKSWGQKYVKYKVAAKKWLWAKWQFRWIYLSSSFGLAVKFPWIAAIIIFAINPPSQPFLMHIFLFGGYTPFVAAYCTNAMISSVIFLFLFYQVRGLNWGGSCKSISGTSYCDITGLV